MVNILPSVNPISVDDINSCVNDRRSNINNKFTTIETRRTMSVFIFGFRI